MSTLRRPLPLRPVSFLQARATSAAPRPGSQKLVVRILYDALNRLLRGSRAAFMNYGYAPADGDPLDVPPENEADRYGIQLYEKVVQPVSLAGLDVLEIGCGRGGGAAFVFDRHRPARLTALDLAGAAIAHCRRTHRRPGLQFLRGDAEHLQFPDCHFDAVLSVESSHCYPDVARFLSEAVRVLRPGGFLLLADLRYAGGDGTRPDLPRLREQIGAAGLVVLEEEDVTADVVRALEQDTPRRRALVERRAPRAIREQLLELAGIEGSRIHQAFRDRDIRYVRMVLQRPPGANGDERIGTRPQPECPICGSRGAALYRGLRDRLFDAPGTWHLVGCPDARCGTLWLDPVPTEKELPKAYRNYYTHDGGEVAPRAQALLARVRRAQLLGWRGSSARVTAVVGPALVRLLPGARDAMCDTSCHLPLPAPGARMLEIGFGSGIALARMRELGWEVTGVDIDPEAVETARAHGLDVRAGDLAAQQFPAGSFDAVYLSHVIEHVHDPIALLAECRRVLRPGGRLVVITPNAASHGHRRWGAAWFGLDPPRHLVLFTPAALADAARRAGFADASGRSSARIAFISWMAGPDIRRHGRLVPSGGPVAPSRVARGLVAQAAEALLLTVRRDAGEELVLQASC